MNGRVIFSKPPLAASDAKATSSTTTRPRRSPARGSLRGDANASSARLSRGEGCGDDDDMGTFRAFLAFLDRAHPSPASRRVPVYAARPMAQLPLKFDSNGLV